MPVARIVCIAEHSFVVMVGIAVHKYVGVVAVLASVAALYVAHPAFLEFFFQPNVEHGFLVAVVDSGLLGVVALLVIGFYI